MRLIVLRYPANCKRCARYIDSGEWALYGRGVGAICMDCYVERIGDKALVAKYLKMREYKQIIKALRVEADNLAAKVELLGLVDRFEEVRSVNMELENKVTDYLSQKLGTPEEQKALEDVVRTEKKVRETLRQLDSIIETKMEGKTKPKYDV